jgi:deoxycytidylate deaminase
VKSEPPKGPELVFGLVGSVGLDLALVAEHLQRALREVAYDSEVIRLSELLHRISWGTPLRPETQSSRDQYILSHQDKGNELREQTGRGDALALLAVAAVRVLRSEGDLPPPPLANDQASSSAVAPQLRPSRDREDEDDDPTPLFDRVKKPKRRFAYILRSLKHPDEAKTLTDIYGKRFILIGAYASDRRDEADLAAAIAHSKASSVTAEHEEEAHRIAERDSAEIDNPFGQNVRDTYPLADCFVDVSSEDRLKREIQRFIELLFGTPVETPRRDEYAMFLASGAKLRSAALGRQVGAAILDAAGAVIAMGTNEVPKAGGGQYWAGEAYDRRDHEYDDGSDSSDIMRRAILAEILGEIRKRGFDVPGEDDLLPVMRGTKVGKMVEFGRAVHAELAAIVDAARRGVSVQGATLYTTTFPCHNCARHIVAAGIQEVVYVEPYAKSLATELHKDAIVLDASSADHRKVVFRPFVGVAPSRYVDVFTMLKRKDDLGFRMHFEAGMALPRDIDLQPFYQLREWRGLINLALGLRDAGMTLTDDLIERAGYDEQLREEIHDGPDKGQQAEA